MLQHFSHYLTASVGIGILALALASHVLFADEATTQTSTTKPATTQTSWPWRPDNGDGTYKNPIIFADYSDPDVIRVGDDFYLTASSFSCFPGLPILRSKDLVNWTIIGHAIDKYPVERFKSPVHGGGVWAPPSETMMDISIFSSAIPITASSWRKHQRPSRPVGAAGSGQRLQRLDRHLPLLGR